MAVTRSSAGLSGASWLARQEAAVTPPGGRLTQALVLPLLSFRLARKGLGKIKIKRSLWVTWGPGVVVRRACRGSGEGVWRKQGRRKASSEPAAAAQRTAAGGWQGQQRQEAAAGSPLSSEEQTQVSSGASAEARPGPPCGTGVGGRSTDTARGQGVSSALPLLEARITKADAGGSQGLRPPRATERIRSAVPKHLINADGHSHIYSSVPPGGTTVFLYSPEKLIHDAGSALLSET